MLAITLKPSRYEHSFEFCFFVVFSLERAKNLSVVACHCDTNPWDVEVSFSQFRKKFHGIFLTGYFYLSCTAMPLPSFSPRCCKFSRFNSSSQLLEFSSYSHPLQSLLRSSIIILRWVRNCLLLKCCPQMTSIDFLLLLIVRFLGNLSTKI